jgi:UDP-N-acetylglucosamine--N-acetylmuramyl-(pentapeptide) pyrophosphoryl-undecaprenol N-acetylglucosamine transferase
LVGKRVQAAAVNFPPAAKWFRNAEVTGIPVRPEFFALPAAEGDAAPHLLIFGGSQGARIFNTLLPALAKELLEAVPGLTLLHQAGARHAELTRAAYLASGADPERWRVEAFLDDMGARFAAAHLVLARSGASTVAELAAAGKPSLLVPFAAAADDHQRKNADVMVEAGAALMLTESEAQEPGRLLQALVQLLRDPGKLDRMAEHARAQAKPGAAEKIAATLVGLAKQGLRE